jgi:predicted lactoylglutathione lyase
MIDDLWINLPVKDMKRSREFFAALGLEPTPRGDDMTSIAFGDKKVIVVLCSEAMFTGFAGNGVADARASNELLVSLGVESRDAVDELAKKAGEAGATLFAEPAEHQGWMYGCGFIDLDGHRWNVVHMDFSKMPGR